MSHEPCHAAHAYGLNWTSAFPLEQFAAGPRDGAATVDVRQVTALPPRTPLVPVRAGAVYADGTRFPWYRQATFDMHDGQRIDVLPGAGWTGGLPHAFYGTVVAHLLAWRGLIPMHGCAVAVDGRAALIVGDAGAGKSSLTAGLIAAGAALVSDDLSALAVDPTGGGATLLPGRTTIRLDPMVADWIDGARLALPARDTRGKAVVRPAARSSPEALPLAGVIVLGLGPGTTAPLTRAALLTSHLFRPAWMAALPNRVARTRALLALAAELPVSGFPEVAGGGAAAHADRAQAALALIRAL